MKVLFVLSQVQITGAETYAFALASSLRELGYEIVFVSEKLSAIDSFKFYSVPLHSRNTSYLGRIQNVVDLRKIIKNEKIDLVHSHSRAANLVSQLARNKKMPMAVTVHGRWRNHFAFRWFPCLGDQTIAVCPYLKRYLVDEVGIPATQIHVVPNGIDTEKFSPSSTLPSGQKQELLFVGRFSGQKGKALRALLRNVLPPLFQKFETLHFKILASSPSDQDRALVKEVNRNCGREAVKILEEGQSPAVLYRDSTVVIGSGRVALEGLSSGKPVIAIGESSAPGLVTPENWERAFDSNFGDCGEWDLFEKENPVQADLEKIVTDLTLARSLSQWGRTLILERFDSKKVARQTAEIYSGLIGKN